MSIEAMKQAVEWFETKNFKSFEDWAEQGKQINASLRQAIAEAEKQEPVGQLQEEFFGRGQVMWFKKPDDQTMLYTQPPKREWVGLTKDEQELLAYKANGNEWKAVELAEAKLKEKNT